MAKMNQYAKEMKKIEDNENGEKSKKYWRINSNQNSSEA
jgi:hypothetical protein